MALWTLREAGTGRGADFADYSASLSFTVGYGERETIETFDEALGLLEGRGLCIDDRADPIRIPMRESCSVAVKRMGPGLHHALSH